MDTFLDVMFAELERVIKRMHDESATLTRRDISLSDLPSH
jgi:hypothetical protein